MSCILINSQQANYQGAALVLLTVVASHTRPAIAAPFFVAFRPILSIFLLIIWNLLALANGSSCWSSRSLFSSNIVNISPPFDEGLRNQSTARIADASASSFNFWSVCISPSLFPFLLLRCIVVSSGPAGMGKSTANSPGTYLAAKLDASGGASSKDSIRFPRSSSVAGWEGRYHGGDSPYLVYRTIGGGDVDCGDRNGRDSRGRVAILPTKLLLPDIASSLPIGVKCSNEYVSRAPYRALSTEMSLPNWISLDLGGDITTLPVEEAPILLPFPEDFPTRIGTSDGIFLAVFMMPPPPPPIRA